MGKIAKHLFLLLSKIYNFINFTAHSAKVGDKVVIRGRLRLYGHGKVVIGDRVRINSCYRMNPIGGNLFASIYTTQGAMISIGDDTGISNAALYAAERIEIGKRVKIGGGVCIYDTDFHSLNYRKRGQPPETDVKVSPVIIEDDVFVGAQSIVLKGVRIGARSIVGAGSVVTKDIPSDEVWGGYLVNL